MYFARRNGAAKRSRPLSVRLLIVSSVAAVIGFSAVCASVLLDMRRGEEALARQMIENLATGIDADIGRNIELYDLSLRAVVGNVVLPEVAGLSRSILHLILVDHAVVTGKLVSSFLTLGGLLVAAQLVLAIPSSIVLQAVALRRAAA